MMATAVPVAGQQMPPSKQRERIHRIRHRSSTSCCTCTPARPPAWGGGRTVWPADPLVGWLQRAVVWRWRRRSSRSTQLRPSSPLPRCREHGRTVNMAVRPAHFVRWRGRSSRALADGGLDHSSYVKRGLSHKSCVYRCTCQVFVVVVVVFEKKASAELGTRVTHTVSTIRGGSRIS